MLNNPTIENNSLIKIYSLKNRAASAIGILASIVLTLFLVTNLSHTRIVNPPFPLSTFQPIHHLTSGKLAFTLFGILSALSILLFSYFPNVVMTEQGIKLGWKFGGKFGLTYRHRISWNQIAQVDSGGSRMIQWSPNTFIIYHTGKVPVGRSSDLENAVISTGLGLNNYCRILNQVIQKAPQAKTDPLTLRLIKQCHNG
ncbi:MAG: hypothetical protein HY200_05585 [Nitrospirae bacterium]|nr:hypothetical protein [Nitrospirota bacterium]